MDGGADSLSAGSLGAVISAWCASWRSARLPGSMRLIGLAVILSFVLAPLAAEGQKGGKIYRIGMRETTSMALNAANLDAFRQGLRELGYVEGRNFMIEYRSADGRRERLPEVATHLV